MSAGQSTPTPDRQPESEHATAQPLPPETPAERPVGHGNAPSYRADVPETTGAWGPAITAGAGPERKVTRAGVIWAAVVAALVLLILLIVFILQNQELVLVKFLGFEGSVPLGMALFIAAVTGGVLVAVAGGARILQLRSNAHRDRVRQRR